MGSEIRATAPGELGLFLNTCFAAFGGSVDEESVERVAPVFEDGRLLLALEDGAAAGTAGSLGFSLSVPGGEVPCGGVTMVGVLPGFRRRGAFRRLMERVLSDATAREEPLSVLWSTEGDLYGRFGYGLATLAARIDAVRDRAGLRSAATAAARVRLVEPEEAARSMPAVYETVRAVTPGMPSRSADWWRSWRLPGPPGTSATPPRFAALVELDGRPEGYALYRVDGGWEGGVSTARLEVLEAVGSTPDATLEVWRFLLSLDLVERVRALHLPLDHPLPLLVREPARLRLGVTDGLWARLVDVAAALSARSFAGEGEVCLELADELCPWNAGRLLLLARREGAEVSRTRRAPDARLDVAALGSAYLGGVSFDQLERAGRVAELRPGALERLDALFRSPRAPWCPEEF